VYCPLCGAVRFASQFQYCCATDLARFLCYGLIGFTPTNISAGMAVFARSGSSDTLTGDTGFSAANNASTSLSFEPVIITPTRGFHEVTIWPILSTTGSPAHCSASLIWRASIPASKSTPYDQMLIAWSLNGLAATFNPSISSCDKRLGANLVSRAKLAALSCSAFRLAEDASFSALEARSLAAPALSFNSPDIWSPIDIVLASPRLRTH